MDVELGCKHYSRKCLFVTPCCRKTYPCRLCHDAAEDHVLNRKSVTKLKCVLCTAIQPVAACCRSCKIPFGSYVCLGCNMYDYHHKGQFHCDLCGLCRVGGRENFFHCPKCNMCLNRRLESTHKCIENASHNNCPVCLEDIHSSVTEIAVPKCGHLIHKNCLEDLKKQNINECSVCKTEMVLLAL